MRRAKLPPVDEAKLLICEMDERDIESVLAYAKYWLAQLRKRAKTQNPKPSDSTSSGNGGSSKGDPHVQTLYES